MRRVCEYEKERGGGEKMEGEELGGGESTYLLVLLGAVWEIRLRLTFGCLGGEDEKGDARTRRRDGTRN